TLPARSTARTRYRTVEDGAALTTKTLEVKSPVRTVHVELPATLRATSLRCGPLPPGSAVVQARRSGIALPARATPVRIVTAGAGAAGAVRSMTTVRARIRAGGPVRSRSSIVELAVTPRRAVPCPQP